MALPRQRSSTLPKVTALRSSARSVPTFRGLKMTTRSTSFIQCKQCKRHLDLVSATSTFIFITYVCFSRVIYNNLLKRQSLPVHFEPRLKGLLAWLRVVMREKCSCCLFHLTGIPEEWCRPSAMYGPGCTSPARATCTRSSLSFATGRSVM